MIGGSIAEHREVKFIGKCIYCSSTENLHDEHCIPESLNGFHVLEKGSCQACGKITSKFEGDYARDSMLAVRTAWSMRSKRSKKKRPTEFPMRFKKGGREEIANVPVDEKLQQFLKVRTKFRVLPEQNSVEDSRSSEYIDLRKVD